MIQPYISLARSLVKQIVSLSLACLTGPPIFYLNTKSSGSILTFYKFK